MKPSRLKICVMGKDQETERLWSSELQTLMAPLGRDQVAPVTSAREELAPIILVDARKTDWQDWALSIDRAGKSMILVIDDQQWVPESSALNTADDLLVCPFRLPAVLSVIRHHFVKIENEAIQEESKLALNQVHESNAVLERILHEKTPKRFTGIKGIKITSKHVSGLKPGGDYFDLFESEKKDFLHLLMVDSSSYGISAALLGLILSSSAKIASGSHQSCGAWIRAVYEELRVTLGDAGHFSVFFGRLNRKDFSLHYQLHGSVEAFQVDPQGFSSRLEKQGARISNGSLPVDHPERVVQLNPRDRLVLLSDGFAQCTGSETSITELLADKKDKDSFSLINELTFLVKSKLSPGETFPGEDCTAIVLDVESRVLRLAPTG